MSNDVQKSKRYFLKGLSTIIGGVAASSLLRGNGLAVAMAYSTNANDKTAITKVFSKSQLAILKQVCAIVIPKTETLGAAEVDTHGFIDNQLFHCFSKSAQQKAVSLLTLIDKQAQQSHSSTFVALSDEQQFQLLTALDLGKIPFGQTQRTDFKKLKKLICFGYYTSEVGASQELRYVAVPGGYKGSIPYKSGDAAWGSKGLSY